MAWGDNSYNQCDVPEPNSDFIAIAAGEGHSLGLKSDGSVVAWGDNGYGQCDVPLPNSGFLAIAAGKEQSMGVKSIGGEISGDGLVDFADYAILAGYWLNTNCAEQGDCGGADSEPDGDVDGADLKALTDNWLEGK
mgnify:FL=1